LYDARSLQLPRLYLINVPCEKLLPRAGDQSQPSRGRTLQNLTPSPAPLLPASDKTQKYSSPP